MKKLILFLSLLIVSAASSGQTYTSFTAGDNEFLIDATVYPLGTAGLAFSRNGSTVYMGVINVNSGKTLYYGKRISYYTRSNGVPFADSAAIVAFYDSFMVSDGGGGGSTLTLTTTGSSGAATLSNDTLNIPQYSGGGSIDSFEYSTRAWRQKGIDSVSANQILYTQISLSSAQLLSLNTTPVQLVAAPGAGKIIVPVEIIADYTYVSATYSASGALQLYEDQSSTLTSTTNLLTATASIIRDLYTAGATNGTTIHTYVDNAPLMAWCISADPTVGDGTLKINIYYKIMTR